MQRLSREIQAVFSAAEEERMPEEEGEGEGGADAGREGKGRGGGAGRERGQGRGRPKRPIVSLHDQTRHSVVLIFDITH